MLYDLFTLWHWDHYTFLAWWETLIKNTIVAMTSLTALLDGHH